MGGWRVRCLGLLWGSRRREAAARAPRTQLCQPIGLNALLDEKSPHTRVVFCRKIARVCRNIYFVVFSRILQTVNSHTDTYISLMESPNEGSVAQLVVRQIPALKVVGSTPAWVTFFSLIFLKMVFRRLITYWQSQ